MWKKVISALLLLNFITVTVFAHNASIETGDKSGYMAVRLTPQVYNAANGDLSDILVKDSKGGNVAYFVNTGFRKAYESREMHPMELIDSYTKDDSFYFDYKLAASRESDIIATSIEVTTDDTNFAKAVDIYGSHDNINWQLTQSDKFYSIDGRSKLSIDFDKPQKYTYYRFRLANNLEKIRFDTVNLVYNIETVKKTYFIEEITPVFSVENKDKRTYIHIEGLKNLRLCDVTIKTDSMFKRTASAPLGIEKEIYNLSLNGTSYTDTTIPVDRQISGEEIYTVEIADNDDKPINIGGISVRYYADEIVFEANAGEDYTLEFGEDITKTAPVYDISRYKDEILKGEIKKAAIGEIHYDNVTEKPAGRDYKFIFNIVIIVIAVLLGALILLRLKRKD